MYIVSGTNFVCCFSGFWQRTCFTDLLHCPLFKNESIHSYVAFVTSALSSIYALPFSTVSPSLMLEQLWTTYLLKLRTTTCASWDIKSCKQLSVELYNSRRVTKANLSILVFFLNTLWHMTLKHRRFSSTFLIPQIWNLTRCRCSAHDCSVLLTQKTTLQKIATHTAWKKKWTLFKRKWWRPDFCAYLLEQMHNFH